MGCVTGGLLYNAGLMCVLRDRRTGVVGLCLVTALAAVYGPALQRAWEEDLRRQAAENAQHAQRGHGENPEQNDQQVVLVPGCGEWDRVLKTPAPSPSLKVVAHHRVASAGFAPSQRFFVVRFPVSASAILAASGPHRNHAPHAPPSVVS